MTKFRVFSEDSKPEEEVFFRLVEIGGAIALEACDADGGLLKTILAIQYDGRLYRNRCAQVHGLQTDHKGRILLSEE